MGDADEIQILRVRPQVTERVDLDILQSMSRLRS